MKMKQQEHANFVYARSQQSSSTKHERVNCRSQNNREETQNPTKPHPATRYICYRDIYNSKYPLHRRTFLSSILRTGSSLGRRPKDKHTAVHGILLRTPLLPIAFRLRKRETTRPDSSEREPAAIRFLQTRSGTRGRWRLWSITAPCFTVTAGAFSAAAASTTATTAARTTAE